MKRIPYEKSLSSMIQLSALMLLIVLVAPARAQAQDTGHERGALMFGFIVSAGGRYDDVRMCVASPAGAKGGIALDISFFAEFGVNDTMSVMVTLPVMRPILFAAAFRMLQFEPDVRLNFRVDTGDKVDLVVGPSLGFVFHHGPDYTSVRSGDGRGPSFFAMGPRIGAYLGLDFPRPDKSFNFQLGIHPYFAPLFGISDPDKHRGWVAGGMLEGQFRFTAQH